MSKGGGSTNNTVTQQSTPNPISQGAYQNAVNTGTNVAQQNYPVYNGSLIAGFTPTQQSAFQNINQAAGLGQPYLQQAANLIGASTSGINPASTVGSYTNANLQNQYLNPATQLAGTAGQGINPLSGQFSISNFQNPYNQQVVNALEATQNQQNAQQQNQLVGQAASAGAFGGDRSQIAQSVLAGQQALGENPAIAQALQSGYGQALQGALQTGTTNAQLGLGAGQLYGSLGGLSQGAYNTALQTGLGSQEANAWLASQGAFGLGNLGQEAQGLALSGANAQLQAGGLQQQLAQEQLNVPYQQFQQAQAFPYQISNFELGLATGSPGGGTATTTSPGPSYASQLTGLGLTGLGLYNAGAFNGLGNLFSSGASAATGALGSGAISDTGWLDTTGLGTAATDTGWYYPSRGGRMPPETVAPKHFDDGGAVTAPLGLGANMPTYGLPAATQAGLGSGNPLATQQLQQLNGLPTEKLRELQARMPQGTPQGNMVAMALRRRQMMPQSDPMMAGLGGGNQFSAGTLPTPMGMAAGGEIPWEPQGDDASGDWVAQNLAMTPQQSDPAAIDVHVGSGLAEDPYAHAMVPASGLDAGLPSVTPAHVHPRQGLGAGIPIPPQMVPHPQQDGQQPSVTVAQDGETPHQVGLGGQSFLDRATSGPSGALIAAGLGILGGSSPFGLQNIGHGALQGLNFAEQQKMRQAQMQYNQMKEQDLADYHRAMAQNAANRTDVYSQRVQDMAQLGQLKASQAMAIAAMRMGAHATSGDLEAEATSELMKTDNPDTGKPYTRAEAYRNLKGLDIRQQNADTASGRLSLAESTAALNAEDKAYTRQSRANSMDVQAARSIMSAAAQSGKVIPYKQALDEAMTTNRALPQAAAPQGGGSMPQAPPMPKVGEIQQGYKFLGGDPAQQSSWQAVP